MKVEARVDVFYTLDHLVSQHQHRLQGKLSVALAEELLKTGSECIHDHHITLFVPTEPVNLRDTDPIVEYLVNLLLV